MNKQPRLLVAGAINTDLVAMMDRAPVAGETITGSGFSVHGGGKGANQAVAARRSGVEVAMLGAVGDDDFGRARIQHLEAEGIDFGHVQIDKDLPSGVALIFVEEGGENRIAYVPGATVGIPTDWCLQAFDALLPSHLLITNELPTGGLEELLQRARQAGSQIILNATPDPETALPLLPLVDVLIVNRGEAEALTASATDITEMLSNLAKPGPATVILTAGAEGAFAWSDNAVTHVLPPKVEVVDTTGAGDTFCGAFVASTMQGRDLSSALRYAVYASALSVTKQGAQSSIPSKSDVEEIF